MSTPSQNRSEVGVLIRALAFGSTARVVAVVADGPARELCRRHQLNPGAARLASEGLVAAALQSAWIKGEEAITLQIQGESPRFSLFAEVREGGKLRGRVRPAALPDLPSIDGYMLTFKSDGTKELYRSVSAIQSERVGDALRRFVRDSAQVQASVRLQAEVEPDGRPSFDAGLLVERLPDADPEELAARLDALDQTPFREVMTAFAFGQLGGEEVEVLESRALVHQCTCDRDRVARVLLQLEAEELRALVAEQGMAEVTCEFCQEVYQFDDAQVEALIARG